MAVAEGARDPDEQWQCVPWRAADGSEEPPQPLTPGAGDGAKSSASSAGLAGSSRFEPTVGEHLRLGQFLRDIEKADEAGLRDLCRRLAHMALLVYPATIRGLAWEAAENLSGKPWGEERGEALLQELLGKVKGASNPDQAD